MTKDRMRELRIQHPNNEEYRQALDHEILAETVSLSIETPPAPRDEGGIPVSDEFVPELPIRNKGGLLNEDYYRRLYADVFEKKIGAGGMISGGSPEGVVPYFEGHRPRFDATLDMFHEFCDAERMELIYDLGTGSPFASYYFNVTQGAEVRFGHIQNTGGEINPKVRFMQINLAKDPAELPPGDLVICTECLEHLPVNLYRVRKYLCDRVRPGRFLFLSFPLNGHNATGYERDGMGNPDHDHGHIREFTQETALEFCRGTGFEILKAVDTYTREYGGVIKNVLMRKPA